MIVGRQPLQSVPAPQTRPTSLHVLEPASTASRMWPSVLALQWHTSTGTDSGGALRISPEGAHQLTDPGVLSLLED